MGISVLPTRYRINGVISTDKTVMQNMETLAGAAQSWINYDINAGKWAVVINTTGNSVASFSDSNIIGGISVQGTGLRDLYNSVRVEFPHVDLRDEPDFVEVTIPAGDRNSNEPDNQLIMQLDVVNDPVMAEMLGLIELKQSRVDRVIRFTADRSYLALKAGDLIDVTNTMLAYTAKVFRVISVAETDADDGSIAVEITALEYDANVYDTADLFRYERTNDNGIVTLGSIDPPPAPTITAYERDSRPRVEIETTVPAGVVTGIEFWFSTDAGNYTNVGTQYQVGGGTFAFGDTVTLDFDQVVTGNIYAKCRAINSSTSSEFGNVGNLIGFVKTQTTDSITENTTFNDSSTGNLLIANGLLTLLGGLDTFYNGNTSPGGFYDDFWGLFNTDTGTNLKNNVKGGAVYAYQLAQVSTNTVAWTNGDRSTATDGQGNTIDIFWTGASGNGAAAINAGAPFTALETGTHTVDASIIGSYDLAQYDFLATMLKVGHVYVYTGNTLVASLGDNIRGDTFQDIPIKFQASLTAGVEYQLRYDASYQIINNVTAGGHRLICTVTRSKT